MVDGHIRGGIPARAVRFAVRDATMRAMPRFPRALLPALFAITVAGGAMLAGCGGQNPYQAAKNSVPTASTNADGTNVADTSAIGDNEFIPDRNISDCVGTLERPNCGSAKKGTMGTYLTFAVLIAGLAFIFWRISIGVRQRDAAVNGPANTPSDAPVDAPPASQDHPSE